MESAGCSEGVDVKPTPCIRLDKAYSKKRSDILGQKMAEVSVEPLQIQAGVMEVAQWWLTRARAPASRMEGELKAANQKIIQIEHERTEEKKRNRTETTGTDSNSGEA